MKVVRQSLLSLLVLAGLLLPLSALADTAEAEIDNLLSSIGRSDCVFIRNGKRHNAADAEDHLRMKLRRGKRYVTTAETFIERLASSSSMSKKPYYIECPGQEMMPSGQWLMQRLDELRENPVEGKE
jgi:hypothetical protein